MNQDYRIKENGFVVSTIKDDLYLLHDLKDDISHLKELEFKIDCNTYFGNVATLIDLILQDNVLQSKKYINLLSRLRDDLMYLQKNYEIFPKPKR